MQDELLTPEELARELKIPASRLAKQRITGGGIRFLKIGSKVRYRRSAVQAYLQAQERASTSDPGLVAPAAEPGSRSRRAAQQPQSSTSTCDTGPAAREDAEPGAKSPARRTRRSTSTHAA
jgi:excisionase family DNA binding protein